MLLYLLNKDKLSGLPTNNLDAEWHLSVFGKRAPVAKFRNKKFTAKGIRNDVNLHQSKTFQNTPDKAFQSVVTVVTVNQHGNSMGQKTKGTTYSKDTGENRKRKKTIKIHFEVFTTLQKLEQSCNKRRGTTWVILIKSARNEKKYG